MCSMLYYKALMLSATNVSLEMNKEIKVLSLLVYRREDCIMLFVFLSVPLLFLSGISWPGAKMPLFWKCVSWLFPSTFGMNGYVSITVMGCSLSDISTKCIALALQSIAYFTVYALFFCRKPC